MPEEQIIKDRRVNIANTELSLTRVVVVVVFLLGVSWAFFNTVVLPINNLNLGMTQALSNLADLKAAYSSTQQQILADEARITLLESTTKILSAKLNIK